MHTIKMRVMSSIKRFSKNDILINYTFIYLNSIMRLKDPTFPFVFEGAQISGSLQPYPNLISILERYHERPALEKGGEYKLGH
jgi:hypothetical protein